MSDSVAPATAFPRLAQPRNKRSGAALAPRLAAAASLVVLAPMLVMVAALITLSSVGPALVRVARVGSDGRLSYRTEFRVYRHFSAGTHDRVVAGHETWQTRFGALLRVTRIDRLPGLLDVASGRSWRISRL